MSLALLADCEEGEGDKEEEEVFSERLKLHQRVLLLLPLPPVTVFRSLERQLIANGDFFFFARQHLPKKNERNELCVSVSFFLLSFFLQLGRQEDKGWPLMCPSVHSLSLMIELFSSESTDNSEH